VLQTSFEKYLQKKENGYDVDYSNTYLAMSYNIFVEKGLDLNEIMISRLRYHGITPWLSFRMNDIHDWDELIGARVSDYRHEAINNRINRIIHRPITKNFDNCLDFMIENTRNVFLAYIEEQLSKYDVDGIELDFMREAFCFCPGSEYDGRQVITDFICSVKEIVKKYEDITGHGIKIMIRVPPDPVQAYDIGFDIYTWANDSLIDIIVVTPRWATCDSTMPIESWVRIFENKAVKIAAGLEILCPNRSDSAPDYHKNPNTLETARGFAIQYLAGGCDYVYLFNYMDKPDTVGKKRVGTMKFGCENIEYDAALESAISDCVYQELLNTIGEVETSLHKPRRHVVTYRDFIPYWEEECNKLPFNITESKFKFANVKTGAIPADSQVFLLLGVGKAKDAEDFMIWCNCERCDFLRLTNVFPIYTNNPVYVFEVPIRATKPFNQIIELTSNNGEIIIDYIEMRVQKAQKEAQNI
jgi:hypothetical protein